MNSWAGANTSKKAINTTELTRRIQAGSRKAETEFAETYSRALMSLLLNKTQNPDTAKDCCQQTLLIALIKLRAGEIVKPGSLLSFLQRTATNVAKAHFRKERRYVSLYEGVFPASDSTCNDAEQDMDSETISLLLNDILELLTVERDREILRRFYLRDEEKSMIRHDLEISAAHFDRVIYRAKGRLRRLLNGHEDIKTLLHQGLSIRMQAGGKNRLSRRLKKSNTKHLEGWIADPDDPTPKFSRGPHGFQAAKPRCLARQNTIRQPASGPETPCRHSSHSSRF